MKKLLVELLEELLKKTGSSKNLAYELIDECKSYDDEDEVERLSALIRKWKQNKKVPQKWEECIKIVAEKLGVKYLSEKDKKIFKCMFINFLKDIKIYYYEDKEIEKEKLFMFFIFLVVIDDKNFISENIEKEWNSLIK